MIIDDEAALRDWLIATLEPLYVHLSPPPSLSIYLAFIRRCDAEPEALTRYVLALISKDKPVDKLRENCIDRLDVFLCGGKKQDDEDGTGISFVDTTNFVDQLFEVIRTRQYLPEGKKVRPVRVIQSDSNVRLQENVQPEISEPAPEVSTTPIESHPIPTTTSAVVQPGKRYSVVLKRILLSICSRLDVILRVRIRRARRRRSEALFPKHPSISNTIPNFRISTTIRINRLRSCPILNEPWSLW